MALLKSKVKIVLVIVLIVLLLAGGGTFLVYSISKNSAAEEPTASQYRKYSAEKGNVSIGIEESGTVTIGKEYVTFPVSAVVEEVYVNVGTVVSKGDKLVKLSFDDIEAVKKDYETKISQAKTELDNAILSADEKTKTAKQTLENSNSLSSSAEKTYELSLKSIDMEISEAEKKVSDLEKELEKYQSLEKTYKGDREKLERYDNIIEERYGSWLDILNEQLAEFEKEERTNDATEAKNKISDLEKELENFKEIEYNDFKEHLDDRYGVLEYDDITDKIDDLKDDLETAEYNLLTLTSNKSDSYSAAKQKYDTNISTAGNAEEAYRLTIKQISETLSEKQAAYDKLLDEYNDLKENITDSGYVYAECNGAVSSVSVSEEDNYTANQTIAAISNSQEVYLSVAVSEDDISSLSVGQEASVVLSAYEGKTFSGEIYTISTEPARSSASVSYTVTVKLDFDNTLTVYEGMTGEVTFIEKQVADVIYVNANAVSFDNALGKSYVLVYDANNNAVPKEVLTGFSDGKYVEIKSGLSKGDTVLAESAVKAQ